jgi:hypothetical protein
MMFHAARCGTDSVMSAILNKLHAFKPTRASLQYLSLSYKCFSFRSLHKLCLKAYKHNCVYIFQLGNKFSVLIFCARIK